MPKEIERKWLLSAAPDLSGYDPVVVSEITQWYLAKRDDTERRIRCRIEDGIESWWYTEKSPTDDPAVRREDEHQVSALDAQAYVAAAVAGPVVKTRHCFIFAHRQFELDYLPDLDAWMLEVELDASDDVVELPPLPIVREVTDDPAWKNAAIAARLRA